MRGYNLYNFPAFYEAEERLIKHGFVCINPARLERDKGFDVEILERLEPDFDWSYYEPDYIRSIFAKLDDPMLCAPPHLHDIITQDVQHVLEADGIFLLKDWEDSKGARAEKAVAEWAGKFVMFQEDCIV